MNPDVFLYIMDSTTIHPLYKKDQSQRIYNGTIYMDVLIITANHIFCCLLMTETVESFVLASRSTCIIDIFFFYIFTCTGQTIISIFTILHVNISLQSTFFGSTDFPTIWIGTFCTILPTLSNLNTTFPLHLTSSSRETKFTITSFSSIGKLIKCLTHQIYLPNLLAYYICNFRMHCILWNIKMVLFCVIAKWCHLPIHLITVYTVKQWSLIVHLSKCMPCD